MQQYHIQKAVQKCTIGDLIPLLDGPRSNLT
jgi:hypothetical protein